MQRDVSGGNLVARFSQTEGVGALRKALKYVANAKHEPFHFG